MLIQLCSSQCAHPITLIQERLYNCAYSMQFLGCLGLWQVQVQVPGMTTQAVYNKTLAELARTCPPVPGARMSKGGECPDPDLHSRKALSWS